MTGTPISQPRQFFGRRRVVRRLFNLLETRPLQNAAIIGQRRTGKTSLLSNLGCLLPSSVVPLFIDLQGPASSANDHAGLLYNLARSMTTSAQRQRSLTLPPLPREALTADPFTSFGEWLDAVEVTLQGQHRPARL